MADVPNCMEITMKHAGSSSEMASGDTLSVFELLSQTECEISKDPNCDWDLKDKSWNSTFLAFAVGNNMHAFIKHALSPAGKYEAHKDGRPLLHYAA